MCRTPARAALTRRDNLRLVGGQHSHGLGDDEADDGTRLLTPPSVVRLLAVAVGIIAAATVTGLVLLWPGAEARAGDLDAYENTTFVRGHVTAVRMEECEGLTEDRMPDGTIPATVTCGTATVTLDAAVPGDAAHPAGTAVEVPVQAQVVRAGLTPGDRVRLAYYPAPDAGSQPVFAYVDHDRRVPLVLIGWAFVLAIVGAARWKGAAAVLGLGVAYLTIGGFVMPALRAGESPVPVAVTAGSAILLVVLYLAHGVSSKTTIALFGTLAGMCLTAGLAVFGASLASLDGLGTEDEFRLSQLTTGGGLTGIIICGMIIAALGLLNDVTITQTSAVWELRRLAPHLGVAALFAAGMRIGRDHLASTVYTIAFAYAGAALPTLLLINLYGRPWSDVVTSGEVAEELVATAVGSIGLVLAIPLTTVLAALVASTGRVVADGR